MANPQPCRLDTVQDVALALECDERIRTLAKHKPAEMPG